jgi:hypothetical protein
MNVNISTVSKPERCWRRRRGFVFCAPSMLPAPLVNGAISLSLTEGGQEVERPYFAHESAR